MVFANLTFLYVFLPLNLLGYFALRRTEHRNVLLILFSLAFYAWGEPIWIGLLLCSSTVDYMHGRVIEAKRGTAWAKGAVVSSLVINLGLLGLFKYSQLACVAVNDLLGTSLTAPEQLSLPIGISFYTFQTISYVVDVYRGEVPAQRSFYKFLLFVSLFHQLVAGPIVRYAHIASEIDSRQHSVADVSAGISRFCAGLFKKVCIANVAGQLVLQTLARDSVELSVAEAWFGLLMFSLQIYFDFSGYSDMAIGLGRICGFHYHENFNYPYMARSVREFWQRWHISLGSFFRDYLYIPLGGNRRRPYFNLMIVWALTGLWHGASWNFMFWGLYFGVLIALERLFFGRVLEALPRAVSHVYLVFAVVVGWALFYFEDLDRLHDILRVLFGASNQAWSSPDLTPLIQDNALWLVLAVLLCAPVVPRLREGVAQIGSRYALGPTVMGAALAAINLGMLLIATAMLVGGTYNPFLYFRF
ncbi:MBOAT family O-acyltransferase [Enhygromyxa salina]|uniref:Peptidoglycan O-acetyltransferase n=1 Tax=Enhygromyxa salina TaxID=215803 RepID=A0A2S9YMM3_9BACT|nr:MBOAT family O-acyltransferase [Enhygromyxa salina]PRQ06337.1 Peptidoglycan O-acetyltransferase [Enhygromyxa salina]